ncbi:hypothetical protein JCM39194_02500 [Desulfotomaculum varum]
MQGLIDIRGLSYSYEQGQPALQDINLTIYPGELVALVGQNGAGKTTLVKHCIGLLRPRPGQVMVCGQDVATARISQLAQQVGFVFQNPDHQIFHDTVQKEVAFGLENLGLPRHEIEQRVAAALQDVGLQQSAQVYPHRLSRGQRQRVALASVLAMQTKVIILDEPTTGQDARESLQIMDLISRLNRRGHTVLFITHDMNLVARYARRVVVLCQGRVIADGLTREVFSQPRLLAQTLLEPPQITQLANRLKETLNIGLQTVLTVEEMVAHLHKANGGSSNGQGN